MKYSDPNEIWRNTGYDPYKGLDDDERLKIGCLQGVVFVVMIFVGLLLCALFGSCTTTQYVPVYHHTTDTVRQVLHQRDSLYFCDSIYINDFVREDTVWRVKERWHTQYIERICHDTIVQTKTDSVPMPYPVIKEAEKKLSWFDNFLMTAGISAIVFLVVAVAVGRIYSLFKK
jgi:hypothetical protein